MKKQRNKNIDKHKNSWHNLETVSEDGSNNNKTTSFSIQPRPETNVNSNETKSIVDKMHYKLANSLKILSFITCAEISFKNAKTLKQKLHIGFVFFCCCYGIFRCSSYNFSFPLLRHSRSCFSWIACGSSVD